MPKPAGGELHPLLLLALVAEPHSHHILLQVQLLRDLRDLLARGPGLHGEVGFQRAFFWRRDGGPLPFLLVSSLFRFPFPCGSFRLLQPRHEDGLEGDHVVVAERQGLEPADGGLGEAPHAWNLGDRGECCLLWWLIYHENTDDKTKKREKKIKNQNWNK